MNISEQEALRIRRSIALVAKARLRTVDDKRTVMEKLDVCREVIADLELAERLREETGHAQRP